MDRGGMRANTLNTPSLLVTDNILPLLIELCEARTIASHMEQGMCLRCLNTLSICWNP